MEVVGVERFVLFILLFWLKIVGVCCFLIFQVVVVVVVDFVVKFNKRKSINNFPFATRERRRSREREKRRRRRRRLFSREHARDADEINDDDDDDDDDGKEKVVAVLLESKNRRDVSSVRRLFEKREIVFWKRETRRVVGVFDEDVVAGIGKGGG